MMTGDDLLAPTDDAFIRTAIRGLRPPEHHPAFWTELTNELDAAEEQLVAQGVLGPPPQAAVAPEPRPQPAPALVVRLPEAPREAVPEPALPRVPHPPRREPLRARPPAHAAADAPERVRAFGAGSSAPRPVPAVHHDPAVLPESLRRSSNAILLAVAVAAAVVALVAGLTLVRQRSDAGGPPPSEQPSAAVAEVPANSSEGPRTPE